MAVISPVGAALTELSLGGVQLISHQAAGSPDSMFFGSLLAPWPNRLAGGSYSFGGREFKHPILDAQGNANHGLLFDRALKLVEHSEATVSFGYLFGQDVGYPFSVDLMVTYTITEDEFRFDATARNLGDDAPFGLGFHPYFLVGEDFSFSAEFTNQITVDQKMIPVGEKLISGFRYSGGNLDDCFYGARQGYLETEEYELELSLLNGFDYFMLYRPMHSSASMLAIEPMSCRTNAFNTDLSEVLLSKNESKVYSFSIRKR